MTPPQKKRKKRLTHDQRILIYCLAAGLPSLLIAAFLLWKGQYTPKTQWTLGLVMVIFWLGFALSLREHVVRPLQTISNLLSALREEDFSIRARRADPRDPLGEVMIEVNALSGMLREQRLGALEASALLRKVMEEIEVAVFTFDDEQRLRLVNRAGERLIGHHAEKLLGRTADELNLAQCLSGEAVRILDAAFPATVGRWQMRRSSFRQGGLPHQLIVLTDLSRALREEERRVWQRLIRVIGHELNNSLAPIKSIAGSLENLIGKKELPPDWQEDAQKGLSVIVARAQALSNFMQSYSKLARLPQPQPQKLKVGELIDHVTGLDKRIPVNVVTGEDLEVEADPEQLEQLLINLLRNAIDAVLETKGNVKIGWANTGNQVEIWIDDEGPGLPNSANLFVPFFTTKPGGSGIGLVLSRQIAEAHGGSLSIENKPSGGCIARLKLPLQPK